jgi:uncharacterized protein YaiL (DUF2058 family)
MSTSLRDQLLKAGVANKQQVAKVASEKRKKHKRKGANSTVDKDKQQVQQAQSKKVEHDRELNRQSRAAADNKALAAQIRQLIEANRLSREHGDVPYSFVDGTRVRKLYVLEEMARELAAGRLAIARFGDSYEIVSDHVAAKISERDTKVIIVNAQPEPDADDSYADFQVPDDLRW